MADNVTPLQRDLYEIAQSLEQAGHPHLATIVDECNHEVHTRVASVKRRKPRQASRDEVKLRNLKNLRWARAELRDIARELKKSGNTLDIRQARQLLKFAEDLAEEEILIEGPVVDTSVEDSTPMDDDLGMGDVEIHDEDFNDGGVDELCEIVCNQGCDDDSVEDDDFGGIEELEDDIESDDSGEVAELEDETVEEEEEELPVLDTYEACVKELRACVRELRSQGDNKRAAKVVGLIRQIRADADGVEPTDMPEPNGESDVVDSTDYDFGDIDLSDITDEVEGEIADEEILDFDAPVEDEGDDLDGVEDADLDATDDVIDEESFDDNEPESTEETEEEVSGEEEAIEASAKLLERTAKLLESKGIKAQARELRAKARKLRASIA